MVQLLLPLYQYVINKKVNNNLNDIILISAKNLALINGIATHLSGARIDRQSAEFFTLSQNQ